jgi:hypothetical protein
MTRAQEHLLIEVRDGRLEITIGIEALAIAIKVGLIEGYNLETDPTITDIPAAADAIVDALSNEDELGATMVHFMFDQAARHAVEQGAAGIIVPEENHGD